MSTEHSEIEILQAVIDQVLRQDRKILQQVNETLEEVASLREEVNWLCQEVAKLTVQSSQDASEEVESEEIVVKSRVRIINKSNRRDYKKVGITTKIDGDKVYFTIEGTKRNTWRLKHNLERA